MKRLIQNFYKKLFSGVLLKILLDVFFLFAFFLIIYYGYFDYYAFSVSIIILLFMAVYKFLMHMFIKTNNEFGLQAYGNKKYNIFEFVERDFFYRNPWCLKLIFYLLYYFPTNWPYYI